VGQKVHKLNKKGERERKKGGKEIDHIEKKREGLELTPTGAGGYQLGGKVKLNASHYRKGESR